ncbi:MAG: type II CAAX endopeptidase family protein, partial [Pseudomonadota bacterium]
PRPMWTRPFDRFVAPARTAPGLLRLFGGVVLAVAIYFVTIVALLGLVVSLAGFEALDAWLGQIAIGDTPTAVLLLLATFVGMALGPMAAARWVHKRPARGLFGPGVVAGFALGTAAGTTLLLVSLLLPAPFEIARNTPSDVFWTFLPLALLGLLVQTGAEEILFRGYLQQQLAARFDHWAAWLVLPSVAFGLLHYDPAGAGANAWWIVVAATLFGLVAADLTRVTGNIGAAWGLHMVNNSFAVLVVALDGTLSGLSWWVIPATAAELSPILIAQDMMVTVIIWLVLRLWIAKRAA